SAARITSWARRDGQDTGSDMGARYIAPGESRSPTIYSPPMSVAASPVHSLVRYRDEFPVFGQAIYLNSCSLGALSRRSRARVNDYLDLWDLRGAAAWYDTWLPALDEL